MLKLFSGTAHPVLSQEVSKLLKIPLAKAEVVRFGNSEVRVRIQEDVKDFITLIIQPAANPTDTNYMELFFFCDALKRQEAKKVIGIIPYFGYAKQNIQHRIGESVSVNVVIRFIEAIGFDKVYAFDLHDEATAGVFSIPFKHLSAFALLATHSRDFLLNNIKSLHETTLEKNITLISPDQRTI